MFISKCIGVGLGLFVAALSVAEGIETHGGRPLTDAELSTNQITIYPDGRNLPPGAGTAVEGAELYQQQCAMCHGESGEGTLGTRLVGREGYPEGSKDILKAMSVGAWPTTTAIFDFIRRGMPHFSPKSLSDDEVYQVTAWILFENGLIKESAIIDAKTLPAIAMPTSALTINALAETAN